MQCVRGLRVCVRVCTQALRAFQRMRTCVRAHVHRRVPAYGSVGMRGDHVRVCACMSVCMCVIACARVFACGCVHLREWGCT